MDDTRKLALAQHILSANYVGLSELRDILDATYEDGYMDNNEECLLKAIANTDDTRLGTLFVESEAKDISRRILDEKVFSKKQFDLFLKKVPLPDGGLQPLAKTKVSLNSVSPLENGAYLLGVHLSNDVEDLDTSIETPDSNGVYVLSENFASFEDPLEIYLKKFVADEALSGAYRDSGKDETIRKAMDTVGRIGNAPIRKASQSARNHCRMAKTSNGFSIQELVEGELKKQKQDECIIRGIHFKGQISNALEAKIEKTLAQYPDYLIDALASFNTTIVLFDPAEIYPRLIADGLLLEPPQKGLSWTYWDYGKARIFLDAAQVDTSMMHELFHTFGSQIPGEVGVLPRDFWDTIGYQAGLSRMYVEALKRMRNYEETAFTTTYQSVSAHEYEADGVSVFYGKDFRVKSSGSVEEMMEEDPLQYLMYVQMDSLLEYGYGSGGNKKSVPPFWAAFTETAMHRAVQYLEAAGNDWKNNDNLKRFRKVARSLDISKEMEFWKALQELRDSVWTFAPGTFRNKAAHKKVLKAAREVLAELPDFPVAKQFFEEPDPSAE